MAQVSLLTHQRMAWMASALQERVSSIVLNTPVTLVVDFPVGFAIEVARLLEPPYVMMTGSSSAYYLTHLAEQGAAAILCEPVTDAMLKSSLQLVSTGEHIPFVVPATGLTNREHQTLRLVAQGKSDKEIAAILKVENKTASNWVQNMRDKMQAETRAHAILKYWGQDTQG